MAGPSAFEMFCEVGFGESLYVPGSAHDQYWFR